MRKGLGVAALLALSLTACGEADKSVDYYMQHLDEAREKSARCLANGDAGTNCGNAAVAIQRAAREQFDRDRERTRKNIESGSWQPTWNGK